MNPDSMSIAPPVVAPSIGPYRPDLDWLRVASILLVFVHHIGLVYGPFNWLIKHPATLEVLDLPIRGLALVRMPLLLFISGMATTYALRTRTVGELLGDRAKRLLVPLVFGIFVMVPPQIYVEWMLKGRIQGSYLEFYPSVFEFVPYPAGSLSWHHLYLLLYLFLYNLLLVPLIVWLGTARGEAFRARMEAWLMRGVNLWVLFLPVGINKVLLDKFPPTTALINDPWYFNHLLIFFLYGNFFGRSPRLWEHMVARRKLLTGGAVVFTGLVLAPGQFPHVLEILALRLAAWSAMLVVLAWTRTLVTTAPAWLQYARERSFPFYIMHMVVLVVMAYWVLPLPLGTWTSLMLLFVSTLLGTWLLTELCFHVPLLRPFVGLKFRRTDRRPQLAPFPPPAA